MSDVPASYGMPFDFITFLSRGTKKLTWLSSKVFLKLVQSCQKVLTDSKLWAHCTKIPQKCLFIF